MSQDESPKVKRVGLSLLERTANLMGGIALVVIYPFDRIYSRISNRYETFDNPEKALQENLEDWRDCIKENFRTAISGYDFQIDYKNS